MSQVSAKTRYACVAIMELAANRESSEPVRVRQIAERHSIPSPFLVQILLKLKEAGIVESTRGAVGGYRLKRHRIGRLVTTDGLEGLLRAQTIVSGPTPWATLHTAISRDIASRGTLSRFKKSGRGKFMLRQ